jgi:hypothetical protein
MSRNFVPALLAIGVGVFTGKFVQKSNSSLMLSYLTWNFPICRLLHLPTDFPATTIREGEREPRTLWLV